MRAKIPSADFRAAIHVKPGKQALRAGRCLVKFAGRPSIHGMKAVWVVMVVVCSSRIASAQPVADPAMSDAEHGTMGRDPRESPGFVAIDRLDASSRAGIDLTYLGPHDDNFTERLSLFRATAHARYVDKASGLGGYVRMPFAYASTSEGTTTDFGDIEVGGIFAPKLRLPSVGVVLHAGVTLPTGESGDRETTVGLAESLIALPDFYNSLPRSTTIKLGASPMIRMGTMFARIDLGLDLNAGAKNRTIGTGIHYNVGIGTEIGRAAVMLESENLSVLDQHVTNGGVYRGAMLNAFAVSARVNSTTVLPYFAVIMPVEDDIKLVDIAVTVGAEIGI